MNVEDLRVEQLVNPQAVGEARPRLSWVVTSEGRGDVQTAYRIQVASSPGLHGGQADVWDSGQVRSSRTAHVSYAGPPLASRRQVWWRVQVWDGEGAPSPWTPPATWTAGMMKASDWLASWIAPPAEVRRPQPMAGIDPTSWGGNRPGLLRRPFTVSTTRPVRRAVAYASALGLFELHVNGVRVGDDVLTPGWTDYRARRQYRVYDVTTAIAPGTNAVGVHLADGWFSGRVGWRGQVYGDHPRALVQLHVEYADGGEDVIVTDGTWRAAPSWLSWSDLIMGEAQDLSRCDPAWSTATLDDGDWLPVDVEPLGDVPLVAPPGPPVRRLAELPARTITEREPGHYVVDMGQNMVGWVRLRVDGDQAGTVVLRHAELLEPDGSLHTANLRTALCTDVHLVGGGLAVDVEPHFTYRGFRYVEITGLATAPSPDAITGVVVGSDCPETGWFECSNPMVNQLQRNIEWGQRGNFVDVPTDCPQRDERLGWMGDAQIFVRTASWNADVLPFFTKWLADVQDAQSADGAFPDVAPLLEADLFTKGAPGWGDAGVIVPWVLYRRYGDIRLLERHYDGMVTWVRYLERANPDLLWRRERHLDYGDWLSVAADTPKEVLATAFFAHSAWVVAQAAAALGRDDDAADFGQLFERVRAAFNAAYVTPTGRVVGHTQTSYVLALAFDLLPDHLREAAAGFLVEDIEAKGGHLSTGFLGVGHIQHVLTRTGHLDIAYSLLERDTFPSWGYSIKHGATTIWERWDGWTEERGFQTAQMNSFNHYSLGSVGDWLYTVVAGIGTDDAVPGFTRFTIRPQPGGTLTWARAGYRSTAGLIQCGWSIEPPDGDGDGTGDGDGGRSPRRLRLDVVVPANTTAAVHVPASGPDEVQEGGGPASKAPGVSVVGGHDGRVVFEVGSGSYRFEAPWPAPR
jgi:alpha-L-rhamnosidase